MTTVSRTTASIGPVISISWRAAAFDFHAESSDFLGILSPQALILVDPQPQCVRIHGERCRVDAYALHVREQCFGIAPIAVPFLLEVSVALPQDARGEQEEPHCDEQHAINGPLHLRGRLGV